MTARITKLNNVDISTYGLILQKYDGDLDMSSRKKTTEDWKFLTNDIMFEDKKISFYFFGQYASALALGTAISSFSTNVQSVVEGTLSTRPPNYDLTHPEETWIGRFVSGAQITIGFNNTVFIKLVMTWQGKTM